MVPHGRYTVVRKLAEGGMAEIFHARQHGSQGFQKPVVLKRIHTAFYADEQFRNMLIDEAHISMTLQHNNVVQVLDLGEARGRYFLVLELVDGWDLGRIMLRAQNMGTPLPIGLGLYVTAEVCRALAYAHDKRNHEGVPLGIVHRDVSPQNVLVSEQGEVKLTDFGIAKAMTKRDQTHSGVVKGKIGFMSPEQASGLAIDRRSDLYSVGILLYLLATGRRPFEGATDLETLLRVQKGDFMPLAETGADVPPALAALIERAMTFDPVARYQTADELLVDIEGILRTTFGSPGQTELKLWLADLTRRDGVLPISRAPAIAEDGEPGEMDAGPLELATEAGGRRTGESTAVGHVAKGSGRTPIRMTGAEATMISDLSLPMPSDDDAPVERMRRRGGSGTFVAALLLAGAAGAGWWFLRGTGVANDEAAAEATPDGGLRATPPRPEPEATERRPGPADPGDNDRPRTTAAPAGSDNTAADNNRPRPAEKNEPRDEAPRREGASGAAGAEPPKMEWRRIEVKEPPPVAPIVPTTPPPPPPAPPAEAEKPPAEKPADPVQPPAPPAEAPAATP